MHLIKLQMDKRANKGELRNKSNYNQDMVLITTYETNQHMAKK